MFRFAFILSLCWVTCFGQLNKDKFQQNLLSGAEGGGLMRTVYYPQLVTVSDSTITFTATDIKTVTRLKFNDEPTSITANVMMTKAYTDEDGNKIRVFSNIDAKGVQILIIKRPDGSYSTIYNIFDKVNRARMFYQTDYDEKINAR